MEAYDRKDLIVTKMIKYWTQGKHTLKQLHMLELNQFKRKNTFFFFACHYLDSCKPLVSDPVVLIFTRTQRKVSPYSQKLTV